MGVPGAASSTQVNAPRSLRVLAESATDCNRDGAVRPSRCPAGLSWSHGELWPVGGRTARRAAEACLEIASGGGDVACAAFFHGGESAGECERGAHENYCREHEQHC